MPAPPRAAAPQHTTSYCNFQPGTLRFNTAKPVTADANLLGKPQAALTSFSLSERNLFPRGMKWLADEIRNAGFVPGIWVAPFAANENSQLAREHPEFLLRNAAGAPGGAGGTGGDGGAGGTIPPGPCGGAGADNFAGGSGGQTCP
jgi:hypothetical protein